MVNLFHMHFTYVSLVFHTFASSSDIIPMKLPIDKSFKKHSACLQASCSIISYIHLSWERNISHTTLLA